MNNLPCYAQINVGGINMQNFNKDIACSVDKCKYNFHGCNCTLDRITVGCSCNSDRCTCCESYSEDV